MFNTRKRNPKPKTLRKRADEDDNHKGKEPGDNTNTTNDDDDDDVDETAAAIAQVKRKRKFLDEIQYKQGTNAEDLLRSSSSASGPLLEGETTYGKDADAAAVDESRLQTTTIVASSSTSQEGIMERKHKEALAAYVESKLKDDDEEGGDAANTKNKQTGDATANTTKHLTKEDLYRELAETSERMVGKSTNNANPAAASSSSDAAKKNGGAEGDVGSGGAMLVAGTGLAEVILPLEERLKAVQDTAATQQTQQYPAKNKNTYYGMPTSHAPVPAGTARFQVSAADKHRHFAGGGGPYNNNNNNNRNSNNNEPDRPETEDKEESAMDKGRMGFDVSRGRVTASTTTTTGATATGTGNNNNNKSDGGNNRNNNNNNRNTRASDDKVYGKFIKRQRENQRR